ncbi:uncharacterized protein LOC108670412 isoform X1 [Hyalella azteca]|uniref:Uncharacterized protein LOC108670412 isoform X1 n=1 Tax=Hyalella azteca TaxID=294128 RepID=A0A8B7NIB4_HYAAZ|nr:uncharacterized protein LOC108670412 isoform X1 [Hyalella azteca]XP_018013373.1 uncharacterized protein LOC108670412 isoform X1 [Hyalella azteca]
MELNLDKLQEYLEELNHLKTHGTKTVMLDDVLDAEIHCIGNKIKALTLEKKQQELLASSAKMQEALREASKLPLREQLEKQIVAIRDEADSISIELAGMGLPSDEVKKRLCECEELISLITCKLETAIKSNTADNVSLAGLPITSVAIQDWDQTEKFVKLYLDMPGVDATRILNAWCTFKERHLSVLVPDVNGQNYHFSLRDLSNDINPKQSKLIYNNVCGVLLLKKKCEQKRWRDLTAAAGTERRSAELALSLMLDKYRQMDEAFTILKTNPPNDVKAKINALGFYAVGDGAFIATMLECIEVHPPTVALVNLRSCRSTPFAVFTNAVKVLAEYDCYISLANVEYMHSTELQSDDFLVGLLDRKPGTLATFTGRLSDDSINRLPRVMLQLKLYVSCARQLDVIDAMPTRVSNLHLRIALNVDLDGVKPLRARVLDHPLTLAFFGVADQHLDWLLSAINKLRRCSSLHGSMDVSTERRLHLMACRLTPSAHYRLCLALPADIVEVAIEDNSLNPLCFATVYTTYKTRGCKLYYNLIADPANVDVPIAMDWFA